MYKRPKSEETDEDLLMQQEEFLQKLKENKIKLAAKVVASEKSKETKENASKTDVDNDIEEQLSNTFECVPSNSNIGHIIEKRKLENECDISSPIFNSNFGFPKAKRRDVNIRSGKKSIFSQNMKKSERISSGEPMDTNSSVHDKNSVDISPGRFIKESKILEEADKDRIHEQNINVLKSTPESEILEEKERLLTTMDPAIISFLKSRRKNEKHTTSNPSIHIQNEAGRDLNLENIRATEQILDIQGSEKWLNFDLLETHKLAWMKDIEVPKIDKNKSFDARFDFDGWLLPFTEPEINEKNRILFHHGEEPERPGYTLQELFTLARSSVIQQKIVALNTISNILSLSSTGLYQDILEVPIEQLFFLVRFCLDDNTPGVLNASVKAMRCIICNNIDEICLDCLLGFGFENDLPILPVDNVTEDDYTINDQQLAESNMIRCLVRTGIFTRIRYIINTIRPPLETVVYCIEILIRLSKDSEFVLSELLNTENLISPIIENFVPLTDFHFKPDMAYGTPIIQAIKLVRILCSRNKNIASQFVEKYGITEKISNYLQNETFGSNTNGIKLQTECFHLWRILLEYNLSLDYSRTLLIILLKHLSYHFKHTSVDSETTYAREGHCASVLILLGKFLTVNPSFILKFEILILDCLSKWCQQFHQIVNFKCGKSQIIAALIFMCTMIYGYSKLTNGFEKSIANLMKSTGFFTCTEGIQKSSMLLNNYEPQSFSANLKTLQTSAWYTADHVIPIMQTTSCLPFISSLSEFVLKSTNASLKLSFLIHPNIKEYIDQLEKQSCHFLTSHWFTRIETRLLMNILHIAVDVKVDLDTAIFYALAIKALSVFNKEQKKDINFILENIIFSRSFYPSDVLMKNLKLAEKNEQLELSLSSLPEIRDVYTQVLGLKSIVKSELSFCIDIGEGNIIPVDWIYTPIIMLYSNQQEKRNLLPETQQIFIVKNCLKWISIYEIYFPTLAAALNPTDRFCRLACVFLGSDELFLNEDIHNLLDLCLRNILDRFEDDLNFDKPVEGLKNFQDFYNQMLEQYQGVSYGDVLFGNFVLVPLSQKQNVQWRKTLWSEYMGAVQILNIPKEKLMTKLDNYLYPLEEDDSLLRCYKMALARNSARQKSVLHLIATHHCSEYKKRIDSQQNTN